MNILGGNAAGILNKLESFKRNIQIFKPGVYFLQETKSRRKGQIKLDDYVVFEFLRKDKGGGGLLTAVHKNLQPVSVSDDTDTEVLVVEGKINDKKKLDLLMAMALKRIMMIWKLKVVKLLELLFALSWMLTANLDLALYQVHLENNLKMEKCLKG